MSVQAMSAVLEHSEATGTGRVVMIVLADHSDQFGFSWPGVERIARMSRVQQRAIFYQLDALEESEELRVHRRPGRTNVYQIMLPGLAEMDAEEEQKLRQWGLETPLQSLAPLQKSTAILQTNHKELPKGSKERGLVRESEKRKPHFEDGTPVPPSEEVVRQSLSSKDIAWHAGSRKWLEVVWK